MSYSAMHVAIKLHRFDRDCEHNYLVDLRQNIRGSLCDLIDLSPLKQQVIHANQQLMENILSSTARHQINKTYLKQS